MACKYKINGLELTKDEFLNYVKKQPLEESAKVLGIKVTPSAPFITDTNAYVKLGLRVALKEAVKQGASKIAWTTGEQQISRYDLRKQVDGIIYRKNEDGTFDVKAIKGDSNVYVQDGISASKLENVIGKDVTQKMINGEGRINSKGSLVIEGEGLKVGGKGMEDFYGNPKDMERAKDFTIKKEGESFVVKDENGKTIRTFKQENEANKFKENYGLGIVGNVAKSLFKQEVGTVKIVDKETPSIFNRYNEKKKELAEKEKRVDELYNEINNSKVDLPKQAREYNLLVDEVEDLRKEIKDIERTSPNALKQATSTSTQHSIDITPEMREQVGVGLPLFQIVGERGIKNVADAAERLDKLAIAKEMEKAGKDFRAIFHATGWQKGGDKKWRTEISDVSFNELFEGDNPIAMRIEDNGGVRLGELVSGEVLNLYPDLKDVFVKFIKGTAGNGRFDGKEIQLQYKNDMDFITNEKVFLKALVHEIQHYVQKQEGFATGTTADAFTDDKLNYMTQLVYEDFLMRKLGYDDYIKEQGNAVRSLLEPIEEWEGFKNNAKKGEAHIKKLLVEAKQYSVTKYRKVAGEAEANNVMNRLDMPLSERISKTFTDTEDVAEDEKIYLFNPDAQEATVEQQPIPNKGNSKELALAQAKESLKAAWDNLKSAGVVSDPYENAKKMKAVIDSAIELVIAAGAKTKSEIMAALEGYVKITEAQINTIYKAVQGFNSPLSKDIMNDILLGTDSHESLRLLGIMRRNMTIVKDPVRYGQVLALEDAITKRIIEFEETQQAPDVTGRLDIISSFQKALSGYKIPSTVIKDVDITGAYEGLVDTVVEGTTMDDAIFHASTFLRNWYYKATQEEYRTNADGTMTRIQKISTKSFFELLAGYLNDSQTTGAGMISNAAFRLLAELKSEGTRSATYWNGIYDILNVEGQAQMRSNVAIVLASGTKDFSANAFGSEMEKIGKLKSDIDGKLTDEELDEENHSYLKSVGADMRSEEVSRKPTPLNGRIRARAKKIRKDVDESIYETVRDAIKKGCK